MKRKERGPRFFISTSEWCIPFQTNNRRRDLNCLFFSPSFIRSMPILTSMLWVRPMQRRCCQWLCTTTTNAFITTCQLDQDSTRQRWRSRPLSHPEVCTTFQSYVAERTCMCLKHVVICASCSFPGLQINFNIFFYKLSAGRFCKQLAGKSSVVWHHRQRSWKERVCGHSAL